MKHKLKIYRGRYFPLWYVECRDCEGWQSKKEGWFGRPTWREALDAGIYHQAVMHGRMDR
jgi:hypothetical protein